MNKHSISFRIQEKYYARGKLYMILDYLFLFYIFFRIGVIEDAFRYEVPRTGLRHRYDLSYGIIPIFSLPMWIILICIWLPSFSPLKEKLLDWKTTHVRSLLTSTLLIAIAFLFSFLFADSIEALIFRFPEQYHDSILLAYYLSFIYTLLYSTIRSVLAFDYYKSFYFKVNRDILLPVAVVYMLLLQIVLAFLPKHWLYMFF